MFTPDAVPSRIMKPCAHNLKLGTGTRIFSKRCVRKNNSQTTKTIDKHFADDSQYTHATHN